MVIGHNYYLHLKIITILYCLDFFLKISRCDKDFLLCVGYKIVGYKIVGYKIVGYKVINTK